MIIQLASVGCCGLEHKRDFISHLWVSSSSLTSITRTSSLFEMSTVLVIGGTGAQGIPVVEGMLAPVGRKLRLTIFQRSPTTHGTKSAC